MEFTFAAERKVVFFVQAGGLRRCVEFGDRNEAGASVYVTKDPKIANAIRKTSMARRGVIVETTPASVIEESLKAPSKPYSVSESNRNRGKKAETGKTGSAPTDTAGKDDGLEVREYDNYTVAREAITREFNIPKKDVRNPTALDRVAKENGFTIKYKNAGQQ